MGNHGEMYKEWLFLNISCSTCSSEYLKTVNSKVLDINFFKIPEIQPVIQSFRFMNLSGVYVISFLVQERFLVGGNFWLLVFYLRCKAV